MSGQIGQTGRKKDQKSTLLLKSMIFFFLNIKCKRKFKEEKSKQAFQGIWLSKMKRSS